MSDMNGKVFDLDALVAEGTEEPFEFRHGGDLYTLPARVDITVVALFGEGRIFDALVKMLGKDQWERLQASPAVLDDIKLTNLVEAWAAHTGTNVGESRASTRSSVSTRGPSKRTSNGSTKLR